LREKAVHAWQIGRCTPRSYNGAYYNDCNDGGDLKQSINRQGKKAAADSRQRQFQRDLFGCVNIETVEGLQR